MDHTIKHKILRKFFRVLTVILCFFWAAFAMCGIYRCSMREYFYPLGFKEEIFYAADTFGFERALIFSIVNVESGFDEKAVSRKGAQGLMQLTPATADYIALIQGIENFDMLSARDNLSFGCFYLKYLFDKFGNVNTALAAYNAGEGNVFLWLKNSDYSDDGITLKKIPYPETAGYVEKINECFKIYKKLYGYILDKSDKFE